MVLDHSPRVPTLLPPTGALVVFGMEVRGGDRPGLSPQVESRSRRFELPPPGHRLGDPNWSGRSFSHVLQVDKSWPPSVGRALPAPVPGLVGWAIDRCGDALAVDLTSASRTCQAPRVVADSSSGRAVAACAVGSGMLK